MVSGTEEGVCCGGWLLIIINFCNTAKIIPEIPIMMSPVNVIDNQAGIPNDSKKKILMHIVLIFSGLLIS